MRTFLQWFLFGIFVCLTLFILLPSYYVLTTRTVLPSALPKPPDPPKRDEIDDASVKAYAQKVASYQAEVSSYVAYTNAIAKSDIQARYRLVIKETLVTYFGASLASMITFAFVSGGMQVWDNYNRIKNDLDPQKISIFPCLQPKPESTADHS